jgi:transcription antitermination factor NusG
MDFFNNIINTQINLESNTLDNNIVYSNFKRGDIVRIIYKQHSCFNNYKGYLGEIREYKKNSNYARVFLYPIQYQTIINIPIDHIQLHKDI